MAKRRAPRSRRSSKTKLPKAAEVVGFSEDEEAFFRAGAEYEASTAAESFEDLEGPSEKPSLWRRLFSRAHAA